MRHAVDVYQSNAMAEPKEKTMTMHTEDQLQEPQAEPQSAPAKRPARTAKAAPAGEPQPKPRPRARKKPQAAQPEPAKRGSAPEAVAVAETGAAAPETYAPAQAQPAACPEPCPAPCTEACSAPSAEAEAEQPADEAPLTTAVMPESSVVADSLTHGQRVAVIAATLFQDLAELHELDDVWGHRLHLAAQLHDIGFAEGRKGHHKISMRLIEEDLSLNIHDEDRPWVALLARYHRKAWPSRRHSRFDALKKGDRKALRKAASLLRIADALDYTHSGVVRNLAVAVKKRKVVIAIQCSGDCSAERERVIKKGDLFMHVFGRELECICQEN